MSKLFEEALADAKKLKEVAEENAKRAILESVTPTIREFIEEQLLEEKDDEESKDDEEDKTDEEVVLDESAINSLAKMLGINTSDEKKESEKRFFENKEINNTDKINQETDTMSKEKYYEIDLKMLKEAVEMEAEAYDLASEMAGDSDVVLEKDDDDIMKELSYLLEEDEEDAPSEEDSEEEDSEEEDSEEDLLGGLNLDDEPSEEDSEDPFGEMEASGSPLDQIEDAAKMIGDAVQDLKAGEGDLPAAEADLGDEVDLGDMKEPAAELQTEVFEVDPRMLKQELGRIKKQLREGKVDHHFGGKGGSKAGVKNAFGGSGPKKHGYQKSFGGGSYGKDAFVNPPQINKLNEAIRELRRMNRSQEAKLNKYRGAVQTLREQLEDLNLFNAKLLYVNKLLQNKGLTESQKKSVIRALDEAKSLNETKALYKSLTESLSVTSSKRRNTLNESIKPGSSSRVTTSSSSKGNASVGEMTRWQKLAGIK